MSADDPGPDIPALPSAAALHAYMKAAGWEIREPGGPAGCIWVKDGRRIGVPYGDDTLLVPGVIGRLAVAEGRAYEVTEAAVLAYGAVMAVSAPAVTSPAPAPAKRSATATEPGRGNDGGAPSSPVAASREALGRLVHEIRLAHNGELDRPFGVEPWERRSPRQRELDMRIGHAVANYALTGNAITWGTSCTSCARVLDSAVAERERAEQAEAQLEHAKAALAGDNEGVRLWMLDCSSIAGKHREHASAAEAKLAEIATLCRNPAAFVGQTMGAGRVVPGDRMAGVLCPGCKPADMAVPVPASPAELEAAGQLRLPGVLS